MNTKQKCPHCAAMVDAIEIDQSENHPDDYETSGLLRCPRCRLISDGMTWAAANEEAQQ